MAHALTIRLDDICDWGVQGSDEERADYEGLVVTAIELVFPGADVTVQACQRNRPRVVVTTRDEDGRILYDAATLAREDAIAADVLEIAAGVWEQGDFWVSEVVS